MTSVDLLDRHGLPLRAADATAEPDRSRMLTTVSSSSAPAWPAGAATCAPPGLEPDAFPAISSPSPNPSPPRRRALRAPPTAAPQPSGVRHGRAAFPDRPVRRPTTLRRVGNLADDSRDHRRCFSPAAAHLPARSRFPARDRPVTDPLPPPSPTHRAGAARSCSTPSTGRRSRTRRGGDRSPSPRRRTSTGAPDHGSVATQAEREDQAARSRTAGRSSPTRGRP